MARYAVGDLQGHLQPLLKLLAEVNFNPEKDELWLVGDLVNRGPENLALLRYLRTLPHLKAVLGNHDLHLLAVARGVRPPRPKDTIVDVLEARDRDVLLSWLQQLPLCVRDAQHRQIMTHAGIPACWSCEEAAARAAEVEAVLQNPELASQFFQHMYGNTPTGWDDSLTGTDRWRVITNYFTRMRFVSADHQLDLENKETPDNPPPGFRPWYEWREPDNWQIIFGHWAALTGRTGSEKYIGLDTGYGWGGWLTLYDLDQHTRVQVNPDGELRRLVPGPIS